MQATQEHATKTLPTSGYATKGPTAKLEPFQFERREPGPHDVLIDILYCGVCHSDIHQARDEWGGSIFPMVPGHEIVGKVVKAGNKVEKWKLGNTVGVGCFVDSCRECEACKAGEEQYCHGGKHGPAMLLVARHPPQRVCQACADRENCKHLDEISQRSGIFIRMG